MLEVQTVAYVEDFFRYLYEQYGIDLPIFYDAWYREQAIDGALTTVELSIVTILLSLVVGVIGAAVQRSPLRLLRWFVTAYIQIFRNTPPLVQMYFFYFSLSGLSWFGAAGSLEGVFTNFFWAALSLSFFAGAFNVESIRAGIEAVPRETIEAAEALGYSRLQQYAYVILPLSLRISLPSLTNNLVNLMKTTTLAYAIGVSELMYVSAQIWSQQLNVIEMMNMLLLAYVALIAAFVWVMRRLERHLQVPGFGR